MIVPVYPSTTNTHNVNGQADRLHLSCFKHKWTWLTFNLPLTLSLFALRTYGCEQTNDNSVPICQRRLVAFAVAMSCFSAASTLTLNKRSQCCCQFRSNGTSSSGQLCMHRSGIISEGDGSVGMNAENDGQCITFVFP
eukprot:COSAG06_NODE_3365_length_5449_cov_2.510280_7_plen_138_part_00